MLSVSNHMRIFLARDPVDMRKSFHGLIGLTDRCLLLLGRRLRRQRSKRPPR